MDYPHPELLAHALTVAVLFFTALAAVVSYAWGGR